MDTDPDDANGRSSAKADIIEGAMQALESLVRTSGRSRDEQNQALRDVAHFTEDNDCPEFLDKAHEFAVKSLGYAPFEADQQIVLETAAEEPASLAEQAWQDEDWKRAAEDYRRNTGGLGRHQPNGKAWSNFAAARDQLRSLVDRIESIEQERAELAEDVRGLYQEAKSCGFDVAALRQIVRLRKQDKGERDTRQAVIDAYMHALGDYASTPLGVAAIARAGAETMPPV
jgi:uncharacterized protein (UPF0335 family)